MEGGPVPLEAILYAEQLNRRPRRPTDYETENRGLLALMQALEDSPSTILQSLADTLLNVLSADSAGVSLLTEDGKRFYWPAISGLWRPHIGGGSLRDFGPCGDVFDRNIPLLFTHWERRYPYLLSVTPYAQEGLLAPFYVEGKAAGTIWIIAHDGRRKFDLEDLRQLETFGRFAALAYQSQQQVSDRRKQIDSLTRLHQLSSRLTAQSDLLSSLHEVLDATLELQGADFGNVQLYDELTGKLRIVAHRNLSQEFLEYFETVDAKHTSASGLALENRKRVIIEDVTTDPDYAPHRAIAASTGYRAVQSTPLFDRSTGQTIGMLSTAFRERYRPSVSELRLTDLYAAQAGDVISSRLAEQRLRESEARLKAALDLVELGCYAWNPKTNALHWDARVKKMWGLDPDATVDYGLWRDCIHPGDLSYVDSAVRRCADPLSGGIYNVEYRVIPKSGGHERWIATRGRMEFENDIPIWFNGVAIDITNRKRLELELERLVDERTLQLKKVNQHLRVQVEQRELAESELQHLQRLNAIGQVTSGIAHDFNNLLSVILTNVNLLSHAVTDPDDQEGIDLIRTAAERAVTLTGQLVAFSRNQRLEPELIDLNSKIIELQKMLDVTLGGTIKLNMRLAPGLWPTLIDSQIELVVLNLAINARDAMQAGGALSIETSNAEIFSKPTRPEDPAPGNYVVLAVRDTGSGIPDDVLPHIFEPFFTTKQLGKGAGLGLPQVLGFAKQSGGGVAVDTHLGKGTLVRVFFPRANVTGASFPQEVLCVGESEQQRKCQLNILVVDDDQAVLKSTLRLLQALGHAALSAQSGEAAIQVLESNRDIDLVLADIAMPEMTGPQLAKAIHTMRTELPVILVTGCRDSKVVEERGEFPTIQKPFNENDLAAMIAQTFRSISWKPRRAKLS
jgi:PAS domain S-box-containing protein